MPVLILGGRVLLTLAAGVVVLARTSRAWWQRAAADVAGVPDHWIPQMTLVTAFVFGLCAPALLLPIGSVRAAREREGVLEVPTVLGLRRVPLEPVSARRLLVPGRGVTYHVLMVRSRWRVVFVTSSGSPDRRSELAPRLRRLWRDGARREGRVGPLARGCLVLVVWSGVAFSLMALFGGVAGVP